MRIKTQSIYWLVFCIASLIFLLDGGREALHDSRDFIPVYTGAQCLLHGCNPYDISQLDQQYYQAGGRVDEPPMWSKTPPVYPPSTFLALSALALFRYPVACALWFLLNGCLFVTSAGLMIYLCPQSHRWLATILVSLILIRSGILLQIGQPAILAISLVIIGCCCFLYRRYIPLGTLSLMLSLALKPQIGGLIVLYLIVRKIHWRYAVAALTGTLVLLLLAGLILKMHPLSAGWTTNLRTNVSTSEQPGGVNDCRIDNKDSFNFVNLQAVTSIFSDDAREFNAIAYAIFLMFLAVLVTVVLRTNASQDMHLLSIAALAALTLMPVFHRFYDTRLLLICVPAVVIVYQRRRILGALIGTLTVLLVNYQAVLARLQTFLLHHDLWQSVVQNKILFFLFLRQQNLELPILFCLYMVAIFSIRFRSAPVMETASPGR
jgi:hypothetical protein